MANKSPRSLRTASVDIRFPLVRFHTDLARAWDRSVEHPGSPQGWDGLLSDDLGEVGPSYLLGHLLSKFDDGKPSPTKEANTWKRFHEAERLCEETNGRLALTGFKGPYEGVLELARYICGKILGPFSWDAAAEGMGWGPGASTRLPRRMSDAAYKFSGTPESTVGNAALAVAAIRSVPIWEQIVNNSGAKSFDEYVTYVEGNRIVTVPKNYKTDRTIAIEPCMNMYVQKGIGALMRKRLRHAGCNLDDQSRNQRLAQVGSISGRLATIDLSMASDTVSRQLVQRMIREDWLQALEQSRSPFGVLPSGEKIFYQKFSSMGNGFTFELETVIFLSLALAWARYHGEEVSRISVYGDDIILPSAVAGSFIGLLEFCGFKTNEDKSYWTGPFRESCGKHFFRGYEITPFFVRRPIKRLSDLFLLHNNLYRYIARSEWLTETARARLVHLCWWIRQYAPSKWRKPRLFDGYGDGAFLGSFEEVTPSPAPGGLEAWEVSILSEVSRPDLIDVPGLLPSSLSSLGKKKVDQFTYLDPATSVSVYPLKGRRYKEIKILIPQYALGRNYRVS